MIPLMSKALLQLELTSTEIAEMPVRVRKQVKAAFAPKNKANGKWMLVGTNDAAAAETIGFVAKKIAKFACGSSLCWPRARYKFHMDY